MINKSDSFEEFFNQSRNQANALFRISLLTLIFNIAFLINLTIDAIKTQDPYSFQNILIFIVFFVSSCISVLGISNHWVIKTSTKSFLLSISNQIAFIILSAMVNGIGIFAGFTILLYSLILGFSTLNYRRSDIAINIGIIATIITVLLDVLSPFNKISLPGLISFSYFLLAILLSAFLILMFRERILTTFRVKMMSASLGFVLLSIILLAIIQSNFSQTTFQQQNQETMVSVLNQTKIVIDNFITRNLNQISNDAALPEFIEFLNTPVQERAGSQIERNLALIARASTTNQQQNFVLSYGILDNQGKNVFDTSQTIIQTNEKNNDYFLIPYLTSQTYVSQVLFGNRGEPFLVFSSPIINSEQKVVGVLRVKYNGTVLQQLLSDQSGLLGKNSYPILVDDKFIRIADTFNPQLIYQPVKSFSNQEIALLKSANRLPLNFSINANAIIPDFEQTSLNYQKSPVFETNISSMDAQYPQLVGITTTRRNWYVLYVQDQTILYNLLNDQRRYIVILATIIAGFVSFLSTVISRLLSTPIIKLTETAQSVASGNLYATVSVRSRDEIGQLAYSFNRMTMRLKELINELEDRVQSRTLELASQNESLKTRTRQLETVSVVARNIALNRNLESLLKQVTQLTSEQFGFYHVGIFLLDEQKQFAVLRAANSDGGQRMLKRQHKLAVGQVGIVGRVVGTGEPRIATNVGEDSVYFNNPDLPQTRSEMALPLKIGDLVIGALDVQSTKQNAFSDDEIQLFSILADQIAIAINNNHLLNETNQALEELSSLHQRYLKQEWNKEAADREILGYRYTPQGVTTSNLLTPADLNREIYSTESSNGKNGHQEAKPLAIPITLRGEAIGIIQLQDGQSQYRNWTENEKIAVKTIADQIAQALENARLFELTLKRAERERKVLEITSKIRSANDFNNMIEIATQELQKALNVSKAQVIIKPKASDLPSESASAAKDINRSTAPQVDSEEE